MKLKECEDTHLGEEADRNWAEVVTQQYVFDRLNREARTTHTLSQTCLPINRIIDGFGSNLTYIFFLCVCVCSDRSSEGDDPGRAGLLVP